MTTYNSYEEAKIGNPESDIYATKIPTLGTVELFGVYVIIGNITSNYYECDPSKYCVTIEKFLNDGYKFAVGDLFLNLDGDVVEVGKEYDNGVVITPYEANKPFSRADCRSYVLRSASLITALGEKSNMPIDCEIGTEISKPKRTKVEYVKCEFDSMWEAVKEFEGGEGFYTHFISDGWVKVEHVQQVIPNIQVDKLYRRIETEITERDDFIDLYMDIASESPCSTDEVFAMRLYDSGKFKLVEGE